jgi:predicted nuclease of predicted toxin-antitoxin system
VIRFLLDEHVGHAVATGLRLRGIDVATAAEAGLLGEPDERYVSLALTEGRVIVTHDDDFLTLHAAGVEHAGIAYCRQGTRTVGEVVNALVLIDACLAPDETRNRVEFL